MKFVELYACTGHPDSMRIYHWLKAHWPGKVLFYDVLNNTENYCMFVEICDAAQLTRELPVLRIENQVYYNPTTLELEELYISAFRG